MHTKASREPGVAAAVSCQTGTSVSSGRVWECWAGSAPHGSRLPQVCWGVPGSLVRFCSALLCPAHTLVAFGLENAGAL